MKCDRLNLNPEQILKILQGHFNVNLAQKCRKREIVEIRQIFCYFSREWSNVSLAKIGKLINRDHATVLHSHKQVKNLLETDYKFKKLFLTCYEILKNKVSWVSNSSAVLRYQYIHPYRFRHAKSLREVLRKRGQAPKGGHKIH